MDEIAPLKGFLSFRVGSLSMTYEGDFILTKCNGKDRKIKHGTGVMRWPDGREYLGQFVLDKMQGEGTMTWPDGAKYVGQYHNNKKEGIGKLTMADGASFEGNFYKGMRHGELLYIKPDGCAFHMEFEEDKPVKKESIPSFDGWTLKPGYDIFIKSAEPAEVESEVAQCSDAWSGLTIEPTCCICLGELSCGDTCCTTPCKHVFHKDCMDTWVRQRNRCPLCVQKIPLCQVYEC